MNTLECEIIKCGEKIKIDRHHINSLSKGGLDKPWNKCKLCPNCHRKVHMGEIIIERRFETTKGNVIIYRTKGEDSITGFKDPQVWLYQDTRGDTNESIIS